MDTSNKTEHNK